jgi:hypothetical protein
MDHRDYDNGPLTTGQDDWTMAQTRSYESGNFDEAYSGPFDPERAEKAPSPGAYILGFFSSYELDEIHDEALRRHVEDLRSLLPGWDEEK